MKPNMVQMLKALPRGLYVQSRRLEGGAREEEVPAICDRYEQSPHDPFCSNCEHDMQCHGEAAVDGSVITS